MSRFIALSSLPSLESAGGRERPHYAVVVSVSTLFLSGFFTMSYLASLATWFDMSATSGDLSNLGQTREEACRARSCVRSQLLFNAVSVSQSGSRIESVRHFSFDL